MKVTFTAAEQHRLNRCYAYLKAALDELALVEHKDTVLIGIQRKFYGMEDTLHQYVGPTGKEER